MSENDNNVRLGEGVANSLKQTTNQELTEIGNLLIKDFFEFLKKRIPEINFDEFLNRKNEKELLTLWSTHLAQKGLIAKSYAGLSDSSLIANFHQTGYLDGMYVGYALAMMSLIDNNAPQDLLLSVRDDIRSNLIGHYYSNQDEFIDRFKSDKYNWVNSLNKEDSKEK